MKHFDQTYCLSRKSAFSKVFCSGALLFFVLTVAPANIQSAVASEGFPSTDGTLATVNQGMIPSRSLDERLRAYLSRIGHKELPSPRMRVLREEILKKLIEEELIYQEGLKEGFPITKNEVDAGVSRIRRRFQSDQSYETAIQKEALKSRDIRSGVERAILIKKTWAYLSSLTQIDRNTRLRSISENADIRIYANAANVNRNYQVSSGK